MELLSELMKILLAINNSLLYPVLILLIILVAVCFAYIGGILSEYSKRSGNLNDKFIGGHLSGFYEAVNGVLLNHCDNEDLCTIKIEKLLQDHEVEITKRLERTRLMIRIGPMLGLMGTLIPLGPALLGLSAGNMEQLANNLVIAFTSTVVGLLIGVVSLVVTAVRRRWYKEDMNDMEYMAEILMEDKNGWKDEIYGKEEGD
ncbi:MAG: MotA/TolQ/ExbB proton channel family protein [Euryarchaeota archaeon]|nr:MotA/TolQ/ExbB proton channel family protein [Euryarchaeota archaeon]